MTAVSEAVAGSPGKILASFREIPLVCADKARKLARTLDERGIRGILLIGSPNTPLLEVPVGIDKTGIVIVGGLNPIAVLEENGYPDRKQGDVHACRLFPAGTVLRTREEAVRNSSRCIKEARIPAFLPGLSQKS